MKSNKFLSFAFIAVLVVTAVGCTALRGDNEYLENGNNNRRVYVDDPYMYNNTPMWVRDPYTGRYYQVMPYGYSPYGNSRYGNRYYDQRFDNRRPVYRSNTKQTEARQQERQRVDESRKRILGKDN
jgi:hypothetical protein